MIERFPQRGTVQDLVAGNIASARISGALRAFRAFEMRAEGPIAAKAGLGATAYRRPRAPASCRAAV